jgi:hypothetical protein
VAAIQAIASSVAVPEVEEDAPVPSAGQELSYEDAQRIANMQLLKAASDAGIRSVVGDPDKFAEPEWPAPPAGTRWSDYKVTEVSVNTWVHGEEQYTGQFAFDADRAEHPDLYLDHEDYMAQFEDEMSLWRMRQELEMAAWRAKSGVSNDRGILNRLSVRWDEELGDDHAA